jgi:outer membrane protein, heavy metal efflux system
MSVNGTFPRRPAGAGVLLLAMLLAGCAGTPTRGERESRQHLAEVHALYRPGDQPPALPDLTTNSSLGELVTYAMYHQPRVEAAYDDWAAAVENITVARSRPDPQLSFQLDIQNIVNSVMPGIAQSIPGPGKLKAQGAAAAADSRARYFAFEGAVLQTAYYLRQSCYRLWFLNDKLRVDLEMLRLLSELERIVRAQNEVGRATLQDVYRAQIEQDRLKTEIANLEDSRHPLEAQFKAALGLAPGPAGSAGAGQI